MSSTKSILQEINELKTQIKRINLQQKAYRSVLISEGLIDMLVDVILGPFLHASAINMRNTPEYKAAMAKIKELEAQSKKLNAKAKKLQDEYDKKYGPDKNSKNTRFSKPTKPLK